MKNWPTRFLQLVIVLIGIAVLVAMLWEPHLEGRNVHATLLEIYFKDPFLAYVYIASIPFFVALYHAFKVLGNIRQNQTFSQPTVNALRILKYCALITAASIVVADAYLKISASGNDDPAGAIMLGILATFVSVVVAAGMFETVFQNGVDMKSKHDLTVKRTGL